MQLFHQCDDQRRPLFVKDVSLSVQSAVNMFHDLFANQWNLSLFSLAG